MKRLWIVVLSLLLVPALASEAKHGAYLGAKLAEKPHWFKESFLEFEEDVAEASAEGRRVMLYFHQDGCPYCARLVEENFTDPAIEAYVRKHFDGIAINMWGDREVVSVGGKDFTEKTFAAALKVQFTPTLLFLNEQGKVVLRLNGYYPPQKFRKALAYVAGREEVRTSFNRFMLEDSSFSKAVGLVEEDFYQAETDLQKLQSGSTRPLAVYFESPDCADCQTLHKKVLSDPPTRSLVLKMDNVRFDPTADATITTPQGERMTQREYAESLNIGYLPSVVLFDREGNEVHRLEGFFKTFHVQSSLAYVIERGYLGEPSFQRYISARGEKIRELGYDVDIYGYRSSHPADLKLD